MRSDRGISARPVPAAVEFRSTQSEHYDRIYRSPSRDIRIVVHSPPAHLSHHACCCAFTRRRQSQDMYRPRRNILRELSSQHLTHSAWLKLGCNCSQRFERRSLGQASLCRPGKVSQLLKCPGYLADLSYPDAPREGVRRVLEWFTGEEIPRGQPLDTTRIEYLRMGTTVA